MAEFGFELDEIRRLLQIVEAQGLKRLVLEDGERGIEIRGGGRAGVVRARPGTGSAAIADQTEALTPVASPMVGIFYRSPSPDAPAYVEVGDRVEVGQTIGLIEAMKVFSEVPSDHAGVVVEIPARSGQLVRQGETLLLLRED